MSYFVPDSFNKRSYIQKHCQCALCEQLHNKNEMFSLDDLIICQDCKEILAN